jgi:protein gp37
MSGKTGISWCDATWNPTRGCSRVSEGCWNCYAMRMAHRFSGPGRPYEGLTRMTPHGVDWTGEVRFVPEVLDWPLRQRKPLRIFVDSMSDLFHPSVSDEDIDRVFAVMKRALRHTFIVLTKRAGRMAGYVSLTEVLPNVVLGVSCEDQQRADERIPLLLQTPAVRRCVSLEPLLGPIDLRPSWLAGYDYRDWVIVGGESGPKARPCHVEWIRSIKDQCQTAGVALHVKQLGSCTHVAATRLKDPAGADPSEWPLDLRVREDPR